MSVEYCHEHHRRNDTDVELSCPLCEFLCPNCGELVDKDGELCEDCKDNDIRGMEYGF